MGTRTYFINGLINGTLTKEEEEIALKNPVVVGAVEYDKKLKNQTPLNTDKKTKGRK